MEPNTEYISLRDEEWTEVEPILRQAIEDGYLYWGLDDYLLMGQQPLGWEGEHMVDPANPNRSITWAWLNWWFPHDWMDYDQLKEWINELR